MVPLHLITTLTQTESAKHDDSATKEAKTGSGFVALLAIIVILSFTASLMALATTQL